MKILYIALKYDYGKKARGLGFEHYNFYDTLCRMQGARHQIVYFPIDEVMDELGQEAMNAKLLSVAKQEQPDLCFFFLFTDEIYPKTIKAITDSGIKTYNWFADDHFRFDNFSKYWCWNFSYVSTTDSQALNKYQKIGYKNAIKTQWACNHFLYKKPEKSATSYDISFVGQPHSARRQMVGQLVDSGLRVECFGQGWPNGRISQKEMIGVFAHSKVNLNLSASSGFDWKNLARVLVDKTRQGYRINTPVQASDNFKSFLSRQRPQIKGRIFEIAGCGGLVMTDGADNLNEYFKEGEEIVVFRDAKDLLAKCKYYLADDAKRAQIAEAGYQRIIGEHTYEKRFMDIFQKMGLNTN